MLRRFARTADKNRVVGGPIGKATRSRDRVHDRHAIQARILTRNLDLSKNEEWPRRDNFRGDFWILQITTIAVGNDEFVLKLFHRFSRGAHIADEGQRDFAVRRYD